MNKEAKEPLLPLSLFRSLQILGKKLDEALQDANRVNEQPHRLCHDPIENYTNVIRPLLVIRDEVRSVKGELKERVELEKEILTKNNTVIDGHKKNLQQWKLKMNHHNVSRTSGNSNNGEPEDTTIIQANKSSSFINSVRSKSRSSTPESNNYSLSASTINYLKKMEMKEKIKQDPSSHSFSRLSTPEPQLNQTRVSIATTIASESSVVSSSRDTLSPGLSRSSSLNNTSILNRHHSVTNKPSLPVSKFTSESSLLKSQYKSLNNTMYAKGTTVSYHDQIGTPDVFHNSGFIMTPMGMQSSKQTMNSASLNKAKKLSTFKENLTVVPEMDISTLNPNSSRWLQPKLSSTPHEHNLSFPKRENALQNVRTPKQKLNLNISDDIPSSPELTMNYANPKF